MNASSIRRCSASRRSPLWSGFAAIFLGMCATHGLANERVSVSSSCAAGNGASSRPSISADGRFTAFYSDADNLVANDTNLVRDVFVHDRATGTTERVSVSSAGVAGNFASNRPAISADGDVVAFLSDATNLVSGDTNGVTDIFVHVRSTGVTTRASLGPGGVQPVTPCDHPAISPDGRFIAFDTASSLVAADTNVFEDVYIHDRITGTTFLASVGAGGVIGNGDSNRPSMSTASTLVAFKSEATNMIVGDTNIFSDIFVRDLGTGAVERVSIHTNGTEADEDSTQPMITPDGRYVSFSSLAQSIVPGDFNDVYDVFVRDRVLGTTERVSVSTGGGQATGRSDFAVLSDDGRFVSFSSVAADLVGTDTNLVEDVFLHDRQTVTTIRISESESGQQGDGASDRAAISGNGLWVAFATFATNFVAADTQLRKDVIVSQWANRALWDCQGVDSVNLLTVAGDTGIGSGYQVAVSAAGPIRANIARPAAGGNGKFLAHLNAGRPNNSTVAPLPASLGAMCFDPLIVPSGSGMPVAIWNGIGKETKVGSSNYFGTPISNPANAPTTFLDLPTGDPIHFPLCATYTLQAVVRNPASSSPKGHSVTNAVVIEVIP